MRPTNADGAAGISGSGGDKRSSVSKAEESPATHKKELEPTHVENAWGLKRHRSNKDEDEIEEADARLKNDTECEGLKNTILRNQEEEPVRRWNLRKRRTEYKGSSVNASVSMEGSKIHNYDDDENKRSRRSESNKVERVKFRLELTKEEIKNDFMEILGHGPPRRPNKRPKAVQKQLEDIFPGMCLTKIATNRYKVVEAKENNGKVRPSRKGKRKGKGKRR